MSSKGKISTHITKFNPASPIGFGHFLHEDTCEVISDHLIKDDMHRLTTFKQVPTTRYTKGVY